MAPWAQHSFKMDRYIFVDSHDESWISGPNIIRCTPRRAAAAGSDCSWVSSTRYSFHIQVDLRSIFLSNEPYGPDLQPCLLRFCQRITEQFQSPEHRNLQHFPEISISALYQNRSLKSEQTRFDISTSGILSAFDIIWTCSVWSEIPCRVRGSVEKQLGAGWRPSYCGTHWYHRINDSADVFVCV